MRFDFKKGSREQKMFKAYYEIIQKYWLVERGDHYWNPFIDEAIAFEREFHDIPLARQLVNAFVNTQERSMKDGNAV